MSDNEDIFSRIKTPAEQSSNSDLDKLNAKHKKTIQSLNNLYENITHKTVFIGISVILVFVFVLSRYLLIKFPGSNFLKQLNYDSVIVIKYFITVILSVFISKHFD